MPTEDEQIPHLPTLNFRRATFLQSASKLSNAPLDAGSEVAFAGRSNAGKSSAINTLTENSKLARTSRTPGRTQLINFFSLSEHQRLVDLPGYGYAKVPLKMKREWNRHMESYLQHRQSLRGLILLMDVRHPLTDQDEQMIIFRRSDLSSMSHHAAKAPHQEKPPSFRFQELRYGVSLGHSRPSRM